MAKCQVKYNQLGEISEVLDSNGNVSELYTTIASHPLVENKQKALDIYKNIYTSKVDESSLFTNQTQYGYTSSYKEALDESKEGEEIKIGFYGEEFVPIMTVVVDTNPKSVQGFINKQIKDNLLSDTKVADPEGTFFKAKGNTSQARAINTALLEQQLKYHAGLKGYKRHKGNKYTISGIKPKQSYQENSVDAKIAQSIADSSMMKTFGSEKTIDSPVNLSEDELKYRLLNFLSDLGVKVTSISDYVSNYNTKNGVDPSASALADIANKIVAFQGGEITLEQLTEETAHFIVEGMPQEEVENLLRNIHRTSEWAEHSEIYRDIYKKEYSSEELDNAVRREVLGKVLANSFKNNFSVENRTEMSGNLVQRLRDLFNNFIERVRAFFKPEYNSQLEEFTKNINDLLLRDRLRDYVSPENYKTNKFRFYQVQSTDSNPINNLKSRVQASIESIKRQMSDLARAGKPTGVDKQKLRQAQQSLDNNMTLESITIFLEVARKQINYIEDALNKNAKNDYLLSQEEVTVYQSLLNETRPIMSELKGKVDQKAASVKETQEKKSWKDISDRIKESRDAISSLEENESNNSADVIDKLVERVIERHNLNPDEYRDYVKSWLETAKSDTSYFHATFGQMVHSQDALLGLSSLVIQDTMNESRINYMREIKNFQQKLKQLGIQEAELDQLNDNGYLYDVVDHKRFEDDVLKTKMQIFKKIYDNSDNKTEDISLEELIRRYKSPSNEAKNTLPSLTSEETAEYDQQTRTAVKELVESPMTEKYYQEREKRFEGISKSTQDVLRAISLERANIIAGARQEDGTIDRTLLSESENRRLNDLARERKIKKSPYGATGELKTGLIKNPLKSDREKGIFRPEYIIDKTAEKVSEEARISADLHKLDSDFLNENGGSEKRGLPKLFTQALQKAQSEGQEAALNFLRLNANLSFTSDFWEGFGNNESLSDRLDNRIASAPIEEKLSLTALKKEIETLNERRKNLLKVYKNQNNPAETDVDTMSKEVKDEIKSITGSLNEKYSEAYKVLEDIENTTEDSDIISETTTNLAYRQALEDRNITTAAEETDFLKEHVTENDNNRIGQLEAFLKDYSKGYRDNIPTALKRYVEANIDLNNLTQENVSIEIRNFARSKVLPYYRRLAPEGYQALNSRLENGDLSVTEFVEQAENYNVQIDPNYSYFQADSNDMVNPNYDNEYEGGYLQPKLSRYRNTEFENLFGLSKNQDGSYETQIVDGKKRYVPTRNQNLYEAYESLKALQRTNLEVMGELGTHNLYKLPQISKTRLEKMTNFADKASGSRIKEAWRDFAFYRVDEMERGAEFDGETLSNSKIIPKYFLRDLESEDDLSTQLFQSYAAFTQQAYLHKARRENIGDMFALRDKIIDKNRYGGKENTNTVKMFNSYLDANFFGITEQSKLSVNLLGREIDLTKLARRFLNFIKFKNLGFSAIVPATSWLTAEVNTKIEQWVGEHTNVRSGQLAFKEYRKLAPTAMREMANLRSESKLSVLGEFMGLFDLENRYENSSFNPTIRMGGKLGMGLHQAANFPIIPRVMLSVLYDHRVVNGNIINFNDFKRTRRKDNPSMTNKELNAEWTKYEDKAVYDYLNISESTVEWDKSRVGKELNMEGEQLDNFLKNKLNGIQSRIEEATSNIDGSISQYRQVAASRHYLLNYFMTHRNWLTIATSRRFKMNQVNTQTGEVEEGSWITGYKFLGDYIKELSSKNRKDFKQTLKEAWAGASETDRRNLRRLGIDLAVLNSMALIGFMIANYADDEDNEDLWALQMANYLYFRTLNETASSSLAMPNQYLETLESPFVGLNTVTEIGKLYKVFDFDPVLSGKYRDKTVAGRQILKVLPGAKQLREIGRPKEAGDTYRFYNNTNFNYIPLYNFLEEE